jgi:hypothetical protein
MKKSRLTELIREVLREDGNVTANVSPTATPNMFAKPGQGKNAATKQGERLGFTTVERPKRPSNTKMFTYLDKKK